MRLILLEEGSTAVRLLTSLTPEMGEQQEESILALRGQRQGHREDPWLSTYFKSRDWD